MTTGSLGVLREVGKGLEAFASAPPAGGGKPLDSVWRAHPTEPNWLRLIHDPVNRVIEDSDTLAFVFLYFFISHTH